jgi:MmyB-like transcription regulator ligand binding domain
LDDVSRYPGPDHERNRAGAVAPQIITPTVRMRAPDGRELAFFATVATFGTATEVTTSELSIELAFPADVSTAEALEERHRDWRKRQQEGAAGKVPPPGPSWSSRAPGDPGSGVTLQTLKTNKEVWE